MRLLLTISFIFILFNLTAQEADSSNYRKNAPGFFIDCEFCNIPYYKQNLPFVNFVRDRRMADIYLMITINKTGSNGNLYNLYFIGQNKFNDQNDTLKFESMSNMPEAEIREGMLKTMKKGLLKYLVQTKLLDQISYEINSSNGALNPENVKDKWNFWTFNLNSDIFSNGNAYAKSLNINAGFNANRTTEKLRTETGGWYNLNLQEFKIDDTTTVRGDQSNSGVYHLTASSIGEHLSIGHYATYFRSTQQNLKHSISLYPGIEYNIFPYKEATRRQMRFIYRIGARYQDYNEKTIYNKISEWYALHSIVFQYTQIEKWGSINLSAGGWHYLNYSSSYSASIYPSINFNPAKGLRVGIWGGFQIVNDQFFLRASEVSTEEILLGQVNLKTSYNYNLGFNLGYTFGSRYNSIVNVRFNLNDNYW